MVPRKEQKRNPGTKEAVCRFLLLLDCKRIPFTPFDPLGFSSRRKGHLVKRHSATKISNSRLSVLSATQPVERLGKKSACKIIKFRF